MFTRSYGSAVAWHAAAQVVIGNDMNGVLLATVQVIPGAICGVCDAHVGVAILTHCYGHVGLRPIAFRPVDCAEIVLTMC